MRDLVYQHEVKKVILDAVTGVTDNPKAVMRSTCSINRRTRLCARAYGGHFEQLL
jgi:hypothetical protein